MAEPPDDLDNEYRDLIDQVGPSPTHPKVPALLVRRARGLREPLLGRRARYLITSHSPDGQWLAHGWKTDLRIVSEIADDFPGREEPALWVQEEHDFYGDYASVNRISVGVSRIWVEQYVSASPSSHEAREAWLDRLNFDANIPELRRLQPAEGHPDPVGRRVVRIDDSIETDLRAVSPVRITESGETALAVVAEQDWYLWARSSDAPQHHSLRWVDAANIWIE